MSTTPRALIVEDGAAPHVLPAVRALGAAGWHVGLAVAGESSVAEKSRWTAAVASVPRPEAGADAFVAAVADVAASGSYDVVLAADDIELVVLSASRERLPCAFPHAPHADLLRAIDKLELARAGRRAGLRVPETSEATAEALAAVDRPIVVKARLHWQPGASGDDRHALATTCGGAAEAAARAAEMRRAGREPVLQERVEGELMALTAVIDRDSRPIAWSQQRTLRQSLRRTSCRAHTVALDEGLARRAARLLADLRWVGIANLQFLRPPGGEPHLIDLNGRLYGSLALAIAAGVNVPDLWARVGIGAAPAGVAVARPGVRFQAFAEDVARARREPRHGRVLELAGVVAFGLRAPHWRRAVRDPAPAAAAAARRLSGRRLGRSSTGG